MAEAPYDPPRVVGRPVSPTVKLHVHVRSFRRASRDPVSPFTAGLLSGSVFRSVSSGFACSRPDLSEDLSIVRRLTRHHTLHASCWTLPRAQAGGSRSPPGLATLRLRASCFEPAPATLLRCPKAVLTLRGASESSLRFGLSRTYRSGFAPRITAETTIYLVRHLSRAATRILTAGQIVERRTRPLNARSVACSSTSSEKYCLAIQKTPYVPFPR
jgi:hypothetical protein